MGTETPIELTIGVASHGQIEMHTCGALLAEAAVRDVVVDFSIGCYVVNNRNQIASRLRTPYLLFVDSDIVFKDEHVQELLDALKKNPDLGALSGVAMYWDNTGRPIHNWYGMSPEEVLERTCELMDKEEIAQANVIGTGFLMIDREVFKRMPFPWFETPFVPGLQVGADNDAPTMVGEDLWFVHKMRRMGWKPSVHFGVQVVHAHKTMWHPSMLYPKRQVIPERDKEHDHAVQ